jgi:quinol monooxygenase YgiN
MIVVNGTIRSTEDDIRALREAVAKMESLSRAEQGCDDYTFSIELNEPTVVRITERWTSLEALQAHFQAPHMAEFQAAMALHPPLEMDVKFYQASEIELEIG